MFENLPAELKQLKQWCVWERVQRNGKFTKTPLQPDGSPAIVNDPATWCSYEKAIVGSVIGNYDGVGFIFSANDEYCGVDLDKCVIDGRLTDEANKLLKMVDSYAERSQSGEGAHVLIKAKKPGERCKFNKLPGMGEMEIYDSNRFFVMTGQHIMGTPSTIEHRQDKLDALYHRASELQRGSDAERGAGVERGESEPLTDREIIDLLERAKNSEQFKRLYYGGDMSTSGNDWSRADLMLCNMIAFYTGDPEQIERIFNDSALVRDKWTKRDRYREGTIQRAIDGQRSVYRRGRQTI